MVVVAVLFAVVDGDMVVVIALIFTILLSHRLPSYSQRGYVLPARVYTLTARKYTSKETCNLRISIVPISNITFQTLCKRAFI